jgi:hypothetical protein
MPDTDTKRYMVFLINATKDEQWCEECDTPQEADDILSRERHRASGYAVFDQRRRRRLPSHGTIWPRTTATK